MRLLVDGTEIARSATEEDVGKALAMLRDDIDSFFILEQSEMNQ